MSIAIIFNGQGAHYKKMGEDFIDNFSEAKRTYEQVEEITKYPVKEQLEAKIEDLQETRYAQVAIAATSLAIYHSIKDQLPAIDYMAGLSLGEYSALMASGFLNFEDGFNLLKERGGLMTAHCQKLSQDSEIVMAAVMSMSLEKIKEIMADVNQEEEVLYIANLNSSSQVVIAGTKEAIKQFRKTARTAGYRKIMPLKVEGPFHSPYMADVSAPYEEILEDIEFKTGSVPVISNTTVEPHTVAEIKALLVRHLVEPVRWEETIDYLVNQDVTKVIQIGPGKTLAKLLKRECGAPEVLVVDKVRDVDKIKGFLGGKND